MTNVATVTALTSATSLMLIGQAVPDPANAGSWLMGGGMTILAGIVYLLLTKTLPDNNRANETNAKVISDAIEKSAETTAGAIKENSVVVRDMVAHCAANQKEK